MEMVTRASNMYTLPHGHMQYSKNTRIRFPRLALYGFHSSFFGTVEIKLRSKLSLERQRSYEKVAGRRRPCWRNVQTNGQYSHQDRVAKPEIAILLEVEGSKKVIAALRAGAEYAGMPVQKCILLSGSQTGVLAAERIGMPCVVVRSSFTARAEFPSARAVMEGFGAGDLTLSRLCRIHAS